MFDCLVARDGPRLLAVVVPSPFFLNPPNKKICPIVVCYNILGAFNMRGHGGGGLILGRDDACSYRR